MGISSGRQVSVPGAGCSEARSPVMLRLHSALLCCCCCLCGITWARGVQLAAPPLVLHTADAVVTLDARMPRPAIVKYRGEDLSPPNATSGPTPPTGPHWWEDVPGQELVCRDAGAGCVAPSCISLEFAKGTPNSEGAALCAKNCSGSTSCAGWNMIRVTPTSGQRDKGPLCMLYTADRLPTDPPYYHADLNFECGSKQKLQPDPPTSGSGDGSLPQSVPCVSVIAANGSATRCCSGSDADSDLVYSDVTPHSASWRLALCRRSINVSLAGNISLQASAAPVGATELVWMLLSASSTSNAVEVRAVDLEFAFVGHGSGTSFLTHQSKTWCEPGIGCQEWGGGAVQCEIGEDCSQQMRAAQAAHLLPHSLAATTRGQRLTRPGAMWNPPTPLPPAFSALLKPGRSAFIGASTGTVGYAGYSSQPTLPFQAFGSAHAGGKQQAYGAGAGRIHTNLRCGNVLPVTLKIGLFGDVTDDGTVSMDDAVVYSREQYPLADSVYRAGLVMKLDSDITSYVQNEPMGRITFNQTLDYIRNISLLADNATVVLHLVGWQSSGHDTGYPSYDQINPNLGSSADLWRLAAEAKQFNTRLSYHINVDEAYKNLTATLGTQYSLHPVPGTDDGKHNPDYVREIIASMPDGQEWLWGADQPGLHSDPFQGGAYHISKTKDAASGLRWERLKRFLAVAPVDTTVHSDAYRDINDSWERDERGFIAEDEEGICGLQADQRFWASHGLSFGVEGSNGCLYAPPPPPSPSLPLCLSVCVSPSASI